MKKNLESCTKSKVIDILKNKTLWFIFISICFAGMYALVATKNSDFYPINGDFQNYNPARRFLDGQIPFKDFSVYLGCGEMLLDALGLLLIGNTFTNSLMVIRFCNVIIFGVFVYVISYLISSSHKFSSILSAIFIGLISTTNCFFIDCFGYIELEPGNSARLIRCGILAIEFALILVAMSVIWKKNIPQNKKLLFTSIAVGFIVGAGIIWSNDYGISGVICISVFYAIAGIKLVRKFGTVMLNAGVYIASVITGLLLSVCIITRGHVVSYFESTFAVSAFQKWYYKIIDNNYSIFDFEISIAYILGIIVLVYICVLLCRAKTSKEIFKNSLLASMFFTVLFASQFYHLVSGNSSKNGLRMVVFVYSITYVLFTTLQFIRKKNLLSKFKNLNFLKKRTLEALSLGLCIVILMVQGGYKIYYTTQNGDYGKYLGNDIDGNLSEKLVDPILNANKIIGNEKVFSTYASAIELYRGEFQPTGFDYIIHVLGDENRQKYLDEFKNGNYKYAITVSPELDDYEYWIKNSNWFFYRQLCSEYIPTYDNNPWVIWTKSESNTGTYDLSKAKLSVEKIDEGSAKLIVEYDEKISGTADVSLSYNTEYNKSFFKTGNINRLIMLNSKTEQEALNISGKYIEDIFFNFCLPEESDCYYIPVTIKDGYGELLITAKPNDDVNLTIKSAKLHNIFDFDYIEGNWIKE